MRKKKRTRNNNITYRQGFFDPEIDANIFNHMMGNDTFSSNGSSGASSDNGLSEDYDNNVVKIKYSSLIDDNDIGYISMEDLRKLLNGEAERIWVNNYPEDVGGKYGDGTIRRDVIRKVYGDTEEAKIANAYIKEMTKHPKAPDVVWKINETTTSRVFDHIKNKKWAIVSPYRYEYSEEENKKRMSQLKSLVRKMGYGFIQLLSRWVENGIAYDEESLFIPDCTIEDAFDLGDEFEQSSIIVCNHDECNEICVNDFEDYHSGDIVRTFNLSGRNLMNINDAEEIFAKRKGGPVSKPVGRRAKPFTLKEVYVVESPRASYFQDRSTKTKIY